MFGNLFRFRKDIMGGMKNLKAFKKNAKVIFD